ncbi:MAG TPA: alpha/beta fold hydrolase [Thermodesulfovibrionales bacterium]|nr:alpha/beta fold hydrolase [Thermodesulfovibrionales bacterium]
MDLNIALNRGNADKPAVIFIHGLGMDKDIWINPSSSRILGGRLPLKIFLGQKPSLKDFGLSRDKPKRETTEFSVGVQPDVINTIFDDLKINGYTVIAWSQERSSGPIDAAVSELERVVKFAKDMTNAGIILVGHSRGGLIGRKYLLRKDRLIKGLVTISCPHKGSAIARIACYLKPLASLISPVLNVANKDTLSFSIKQVLDFLKSRALKELLPESPFLKSLKDKPLDWIYYLSLGGTDPTLFSLYRWQWDSAKEGKVYRWFLRPDELFSIPEILQKVIPDKLYPEEMKKGKGDGLVSAESSQIPWSNEHYNFSLNHAQMLFDKDVRNLLVKAIEKIS